MSKQVLDRLQMRHLKELGISANNASAYWHRVVRMNTNEVVTNWFVSFSKPSPCLATMKVESIKTYTLQDILDILPKEITDKDGYKFVLKIEYGLLSRVWHIGYYYYDVASTGNLYSGDNLIDTVYKMLCWCIEKGYISTDK